MVPAILFFLACFALGFLFCFPFGPASLEMAMLALHRRHRPAWAMALGAALTDAGLATAVFIGLSAVTWHRDGGLLRGALFLLAAFLLLGLGGRSLLGLTPACVTGRGGSGVGDSGAWRWAFGKGVSYSAITPTTPLSWMAALSLLRTSGLHVPPGLPHAAAFFLLVAAGYFTYFALLIRGALRLEPLLTERAHRIIDRSLGLLLIFFGVLLGMHALCLLQAS